VDTEPGLRDTPMVLAPGMRRQRLARTLNAAYAEGLLSEQTLMHRLHVLFDRELIDPARLVGDLTRRAARPGIGQTLLEAVTSALRRAASATDLQETGILLALDWTGAREELLIGRDLECDVVIPAGSVSRRHARLTFRDGGWILQDLNSTNGTRLNGRYVGRCRLRPGDQLALADQLLRID
jgi:FHA domain